MIPYDHIPYDDESRALTVSKSIALIVARMNIDLQWACLKNDDLV